MTNFENFTQGIFRGIGFIFGAIVAIGAIQLITHLIAPYLI